MKAIIIGAGQGKRLLPFTEIEPKALLKLGDKTLLEWQVEPLINCGIDEIVFLAGFNLSAVEYRLDRLSVRWPRVTIRTVYNPFYGVADNLATCWMARHEMDRDFLLLNSDTLFSLPVLETLLLSLPASISLAVDHKATYDDDDAKVQLQGTRLRNIGKDLPLEQVQGESIGMLLFRGEGPRHFVAALEAAMRKPSAIRQWYLSVIAALALEIDIQAVTISGHDWCEIDYPVDLRAARRMVASWRSQTDDTLISVKTS